MAERGADDDSDIFVYMGGDQVVPMNVRRVRIHKSVKIIPNAAFYNRHRLVYVEFHDDLETIGRRTFYNCISLPSIKLPGVRVIEACAFYYCRNMTDVEFGDKLESIGDNAFGGCTSLRNMTIPTVKTILSWAFDGCEQLTDLDLSKDLETIGYEAFKNCTNLRRIAMPLKDNMIGWDVFGGCPNLIAVDLVGGIQRTIASLHVSWT